MSEIMREKTAEERMKEIYAQNAVAEKQAAKERENWEYRSRKERREVLALLISVTSILISILALVIAALTFYFTFFFSG